MRPSPTASRPHPPCLRPPLSTRCALLNTDGDVRPLEEIEAGVIRYAVAHYSGQMSEVARRLQIGRSTLYRKLEALGLNEGRGAANGEEEAVATARQPVKIA